MEKYQTEIALIVLPTFINEPIKSIEWGKWVGPMVETALVRVTINDKPYVLIESDHDDLPQSDETADIKQYLDSFKLSGDELSALGFVPTKLLPSKKPLRGHSHTLHCVYQMEVEDGKLISYMLGSQ